MNETHIIHFEIRTNHPIRDRKSGLGLINTKKNCHLVNFVMPTENKAKINKTKREKYLDLARELKILIAIVVVSL